MIGLLLLILFSEYNIINSRGGMYTLRAEILSVGTELLLGQITDTNAVALSQAISTLGISLFRRTTVGDNHDRLLAALKDALRENDIVFTIGGLGPTQDDITRDVLAEAIGTTLNRDNAIEERLQQFFAGRSVRMTDNNLRQAMVPEHGRPIDNPNGTAPGLLFEKDGKIAIALPGPPNEFLPMLENQIMPLLLEKTGGVGVIHSRVLRVCTLGESMAEDMIRDLMQDENPTVAPYAKLGEVHLRVSSLSPDAETADRLIAGKVAQIEERLGNYVYGYDDETLEAAVIRLLTERDMTVAAAESCTGGLLAGRLTNVPGSSRVFPGGVVVYSNSAKIDLCGVPGALLEEHGAVSSEVAIALAQGVRERFHSDFGVGITGIAGPDGGTVKKPVGLVYIAVADKAGVKEDKLNYWGARQDIRYRSAQYALVMLREKILGI